jgi:hypothetical protein
MRPPAGKQGGRGKKKHEANVAKSFRDSAEWHCT